MYEGSDDITLPLRATITGYKIVDSHVEYIIAVERYLGKKLSHSLQRRYSEFSVLSKRLEKFGINLELPPKKFFGNLKEEFIEKRKIALQKFLDVICSHVLFYAGHAVTAFLQICSVMDVKEWILLSMRSYPEWSTYQHRPYCGWRAEKQLFEVTSGNATFVLTGVKYGPDRCGTIDQLNGALEFIRNINNPHLKESVASWADIKGVVFVRPMFSAGTLRDRLYKVADVRYICRHVLEALLILHALSIPFCDVHSGNVLVTDEGCQLIDFEQVLAGQPSFYRPSMLKMAAINSVEDIMVFAFGEFLFELLTGFFSLPMESLTEEIDLVSTQFRPLLKAIFFPVGNKMPSLLEIAGSDLFVDIPVARMNRREVHMPNHVKATLDGVCNQIMERFENERSQLNNIKKEQKLQKFIFSESEKQRRRQIIRDEQMKQNQKNQAIATGTSQHGNSIPCSSTEDTHQISNPETDVR